MPSDLPELYAPVAHPAAAATSIMYTQIAAHQLDTKVYLNTLQCWSVMGAAGTLLQVVVAMPVALVLTGTMVAQWMLPSSHQHGAVVCAP